MKAMLLAAGMGTRLRPLTEHLPKCMVPVGGKPILEHNIEWLKKYGFTDVMINLHYLPQVVMGYIPANIPFDFGREVFPSLLAEGQLLYGYCLSEGERFWWSDTQEDLQWTRGSW